MNAGSERPRRPERCICLKCGHICYDDDLVTVGAILYGPMEDCYPGDPGCPECGSVDIMDLVEFAEEAWEKRHEPGKAE